MNYSRNFALESKKYDFINELNILGKKSKKIYDISSNLGYD